MFYIPNEEESSEWNDEEIRAIEEDHEVDLIHDEMSREVPIDPADELEEELMRCDS